MRIDYIIEAPEKPVETDDEPTIPFELVPLQSPTPAPTPTPTPVPTPQRETPEGLDL